MPGEFQFPPEAIVLNSRRSNPYAGTNLDAMEDLADFERRIRRVQPGLVFVDTTGNATDRNQGRVEEAKQFFKPLAEIATRCNTSIILVTHLNRSGQVLGNRIMGAVRQVIKLEQSDSGDQNARILRVEKTNSQKPATLIVTMQTGGNSYEASVDTHQESRTGRPSNLQADTEWVRNYLASGPKPYMQARADASAMGISPGRLMRALDSVNVIRYDVNDRMWLRTGQGDGDDDGESDR